MGSLRPKLNELWGGGRQLLIRLQVMSDSCEVWVGFLYCPCRYLQLRGISSQVFSGCLCGEGRARGRSCAQASS